MTALVALCFWIVYVLLLAEPYPLYLEGLLFALPALTLGTIAWLSQKKMDLRCHECSSDDLAVAVFGLSFAVVRCVSAIQRTL